MKHQAIAGMTMTSYVASKYGSSSVRTLGRAVFFALILAMHVGEMAGMPLINTLAAGIFMAYVCLFRQWQLLQWAVLFGAISLGFYISSWSLLSRVPALEKGLTIAASFFIILPFRAARNWSQWARRGRITPVIALSIVGIGIISSVALILWARWTDNFGLAVSMAAGIRSYSKILTVVLLIPCFAALNALVEEIVFRGVLQHALAEVFGSRHVVVWLQAAAFAAFHFAMGFPNGWTGYAMTLLYGSALGYLKRWADGLLAPWICHLLADLTIFYYMAGLMWHHVA
jgi:membrane protease YdiL (CAAX protease family)